MSRRFVILDRDGTVVQEKHHLSDPSQLVLLAGAGDALKRLTRMDLGLVIVTNQSAVGRGLLTLEGLEIIHSRLRSLLAGHAVSLSGVYFCPHVPNDDCACRKPRTGLVERAARELGFDPSLSWVIGDKASDIEMGRRVGATTFLVRTGYGAAVEGEVGTLADYIVDDLSGATSVIESLLSPGVGTGFHCEERE